MNVIYLRARAHRYAAIVLYRCAMVALLPGFVTPAVWLIERSTRHMDAGCRLLEEMLHQ
jgi:hypothetical protein